MKQLSATLGAQARVGTVDKFQGQEAPVVIISLARSSFIDDGAEDDAAAGSSNAIAFVLDIRRLNVALSRAQCVAILVISPDLASTPASSLSQMRALSFLCRLLEEGLSINA